MHRTVGDGYITVGGKNFYADEEPGVRNATQLRHQEMNAIQEEIATVIESTGQALNPATETYAQMNQLNTAINAKDAAVAAAASSAIGVEASLRIAGDAALQSQITALQAPEGFIRGFRNYGDSILYVDCGICTAQNIKSRFIKNTTSYFQKTIVQSNSLQVWAPGILSGGVDSRAVNFRQAFTADITSMSDLLDDISSTAGILNGDVLVRDAAAVGYRLKRVVAFTPTSITMNEPAELDSNDAAFTVLGRWLELYILGKTTNAAVCEFVLCPLGTTPNTTDYTSLGWDLYRRIGFVFVKFNSPTVVSVVPWENIEGQHSFAFDGTDNRLFTRVSTAKFIGGDYNKTYNSVYGLLPYRHVRARYSVCTYFTDISGTGTSWHQWSIYNPALGAPSGIHTSRHEIWCLRKNSEFCLNALEVELDIGGGNIGIYRPNQIELLHNYYSIGLLGFFDYRTEGN